MALPAAAHLSGHPLAPVRRCRSRADAGDLAPIIVVARGALPDQRVGDHRWCAVIGAASRALDGRFLNQRRRRLPTRGGEGGKGDDRYTRSIRTAHFL
jgi:hypothetical protein